ncbi:MAG: carbohydrate kinase family protein [Bdellovibrionota bacterium]
MVKECKNNKKYSFCAIGNALVDVNVNVSFFDLATLRLNADAGCCPIDTEKKEQIEKFIKDRNPTISSGGSIANSLYTLSLFSNDCAFIGTLGRDDFGRSFFDDFKKNNIKLLDSIFKDNVSTGVCFVFVMPNAERTMAGCLGDSANITLCEDAKDLIRNSSNLLIEMYTATNDEAYKSMIEATKIAKENGTKIIMSFSDKSVLDAYPSRVKEFVKVSDIVFCNEAEAKAYSNEKTVLSMIQFFKDKKDDIEYVITLGKNGAVAIKKGEVIQTKAFVVNPVDLTGAGDMFLAAYLNGTMLSLEKELVLKKACYMSSKIICQVGARFNGDIKRAWNESIK